jgi:hypothetical protein
MTPPPNTFNRALGHVWGAVFTTFKSEAQLLKWVSSMNSVQPIPQEFQPLLEELISRLSTGWVFRMLNNEDRSEETGIVNEAVLVSARAHKDLPVNRKEFAYRLTNSIVNKGIRTTNRTAQGIAVSFSDVPLINEIVDPSNVTENDREQIYRILGEMLKNNALALGGLNHKVMIDVLKEWLPAIEAEERESGTGVRPNSIAVRQRIADRLGLDLKTVEAATKRIKRAVRNSVSG